MDLWNSKTGSDCLENPAKILKLFSSVQIEKVFSLQPSPIKPPLTLITLSMEPLADMRTGFKKGPTREVLFIFVSRFFHPRLCFLSLNLSRRCNYSSNNATARGNFEFVGAICFHIKSPSAAFTVSKQIGAWLEVLLEITYSG